MVILDTGFICVKRDVPSLGGVSEIHSTSFTIRQTSRVVSIATVLRFSIGQRILLTGRLL